MTDPATPAPDALQILPYGSWPSPIGPDDLVGDSISVTEPWIDGDDAYWVEGRPAEGGRRGLVRQPAGGEAADPTPPPLDARSTVHEDGGGAYVLARGGGGVPEPRDGPRTPFDVRSTVHEYGGGSYVVAGGTVVFSNRRDGRLYRLDPGAAEPVAITPEGPWRYADLRPDPARRRFVAVREAHDGPGQPVAAIVDIPIDGDHAPDVLVSGPDFLAAPRVSPDGSTLAWLEWLHPDMPWDATTLRTAPIGEDGSLGPSDLAAGGLDESIVQPEWGPDGVLTFVSDRTAWWNLYRLEPGPRLVPLAPMEAEFADPAWILDRSSFQFLADGSIVAIARSDGHDRLYHIVPGEQVGEVQTEFTEFDGLRASAGGVLVVAASPSEPAALIELDPETLAPGAVLRRTTATRLDPADVSAPEAVSFPSTGGRTAHASFYPPRNHAVVGPPDDRPPLVVLSHGGPTANASTALRLDTQTLTTRGIAVVDVDYAGSTGYGRPYREALAGAWGVADVDDCVAAAHFLADRGDVDPDRLAIAGGSAGGFTTLAALTFRDTFAAGITAYGIADLEMLAGETHKFESRYLERLVGPYP